MATAIDVHVSLRGGMFTKDIPSVVVKQLRHEVSQKVEERTARGGRGMGAMRNEVSHRRDRLDVEAVSTLHRPRLTGKAWQRKNIGIVKSMGPRVLRKAAERIAQEMVTS